MNGQIEFPKCKHTMPIGAVVTVESRTNYRCSFCRIEELEAERDGYRAALCDLVAATSSCGAKFAPEPLERAREVLKTGAYKLKAAEAWRVPCPACSQWLGNHKTADDFWICVNCKHRWRDPVASAPGGWSPAHIARLRRDCEAEAPFSDAHAERFAQACLSLLATLESLIAPVAGPRDHSGIGLRSATDWLAEMTMAGSSGPITATLQIIRAIQANARNSTLEEAKAAIVKEAAERPLNAQVQVYAALFGGVLEALKSGPAAPKEPTAPHPADEVLDRCDHLGIGKPGCDVCDPLQVRKP